MSDFGAILIALALIILLVAITIYTKISNAKPGHQQTAEKPKSYGGSIGEMSQRIGYDVRDLLMAGFTHSEICTFTPEEMLGVMHGKYTLAQLRNKKSANS